MEGAETKKVTDFRSCYGGRREDIATAWCGGEGKRGRSW